MGRWRLNDYVRIRDHQGDVWATGTIISFDKGSYQELMKKVWSCEYMVSIKPDKVHIRDAAHGHNYIDNLVHAPYSYVEQGSPLGLIFDMIED